MGPVARSEPPDRLLVLVGTALMAFSWLSLCAMLMWLGPALRRLADQVGMPVGSSFAFTASVSARWLVLIVAGLLELAVVMAARRSRHPGLWLLALAAGVCTGVTVFCFAQVVSL